MATHIVRWEITVTEYFEAELTDEELQTALSGDETVLADLEDIDHRKDATVDERELTTVDGLHQGYHFE